MPRARLLVAALVAAMGWVAPVRAHAADHAVSIARYAFTPADLTVTQGDTVTWHFDGPDTNHSVTSAEGQRDTFDSDPGRMPTNLDHLVGSTYSRRFVVPGAIHYLCKVHPGMRGTITVTAPGAGAAAGAGADTVPPVLTRVRVQAGATRATLRLTLSEPARVVVRLRRGSTRRRLVRALPAGADVVRLPRALPPGRYAVTLTASDAAGNAAAPRRVAFTVPRPPT